MISIFTDRAAPESAKGILERMHMPVLLFSASLFLFLVVSYIFILPRFTAFEREDGSIMSPREMLSYQRSLAADIAQREAEREAFILPLQDETYDRLKEERRTSASLGRIGEQLRMAASRLGESGDAVVIESLTIEGDIVTVEGDVRNVGTRSMTVLAAFVEEIVDLPFVTDLQRPSFGRTLDQHGAVHSPFTFRFSLLSTGR